MSASDAPAVLAPFPTSTTRSAAARLARGWLGLPWWGQVLGVYGASRIFSWLVLGAVARSQDENPWTGNDPGYLEFIQFWDSEWYSKIAASGYPASVPRDEFGVARQNPWAFYALYPFTVRLLMVGTGLPWTVASPLVATLAGAGAALVIHRLFRRVASHATALWGVAFVMFFPVSAILQIPYAESLHLLLLALALLLLLRRSYLPLMAVVPLMCLARPAGVPFAALVFFHVMHRWVFGKAEFPVRERVAAVGALLVSGASALAWPLLAMLVTGEATAYTDTETAWRGSHLELFVPWFSMGQFLFGDWGLAFPFVVVALLAALLFSAPARRLGWDLRVWCACYAGYLLMVLHPQTSTFRILLPLFPLAMGAALVSSSRAYRWTVLLMFSLLQVVWVAWLWKFTALPQGGDYPP